MDLKQHILIAEDSRTIRDQILYFIKIPNFDVLAAEDGQMALELFDANKDTVKLVMTDIHMPRLEGLEFARILREERKFTAPIIVLSQEGDNNLIRRARSIGINGWLIKPFKGDELVTIIKRMLKIDAG